MSASNKKKLRNEADAAKLTEKQTAAQKEAKKLKIYTTAFVVVLAALIVAAAWLGIAKTVENSGIREKNTTAVTIGSSKISNAELSYYYIDAVNNFASNYGSYAMLYGLDTSKPLNQQVTNEATGSTWADDFIESAITSAQSVYAITTEAEANGYTLSEEAESQVQQLGANLDAYAAIYGYQNGDRYVKAMYGNAANKDSYLEYYRRNMLASEYSKSYQDSLNFSAEDIAAADAENPAQYSSYTYNQYYLSTSKYNTEESNAETAAAAAEADAKSLIAGNINSVEAFDEAIAALPVNAELTASSTAYVNQQYASVNSKLADWLSDSSRKEGDKTVVANITVSTDENGTETENTSGYYVVYFTGSSDNKIPMANVRHILIGFESESDSTEYTDEEKFAAKASAESILAQWKAGEATEESFAALAEENSTDTGSSANGGLYENVYPGQMVTNFNDWCFDESRKAGDTGIVETSYGYHVMYYVGASDTTYREYLVQNDLLYNAMTEWNSALLEKAPIVSGDTRYMRKDIVIGSK